MKAIFRVRSDPVGFPVLRETTTGLYNSKTNQL